jgi:hypothetical protein
MWSISYVFRILPYGRSVVEPEPQEPQHFAISETEPECITIPIPRDRIWSRIQQKME